MATVKLVRQCSFDSQPPLPPKNRPLKLSILSDMNLFLDSHAEKPRLSQAAPAPRPKNQTNKKHSVLAFLSERPRQQRA